MKSLPIQHPNKDNSKRGFLPYLSLIGPIIRRPILKEAIMSNTYHLKYRIGAKNNSFLKTIGFEFFHEIGKNWYNKSIIHCIHEDYDK